MLNEGINKSYPASIRKQTKEWLTTYFSLSCKPGRERTALMPKSWAVVQGLSQQQRIFLLKNAKVRVCWWFVALFYSYLLSLWKLFSRKEWECFQNLFLKRQPFPVRALLCRQWQLAEGELPVTEIKATAQNERELAPSSCCFLIRLYLFLIIQRLGHYLWRWGLKQTSLCAFGLKVL